MISFDEFKKLDMRVGKVEKVEEVSGSKNLYKMQVSFGDFTKQAVSSLRSYYMPEELEGKKFIFLTNLEPATFMGEKSEVMILCAEKNGKVICLTTEKDIEEGAVIT
jgi:methionine--tRNA ligase beta chain